MEMICGNTITGIWVDEMVKMTTAKKIVWVPAAGRNTLSARISNNSWLVGIGEHDLMPVQEWCEEHNCGKRVSFDRFLFRNKKEITMFLLRWA